MVETELGPSPIHGIGTIRAGQVVWRFDERIDRVIRDDELRAMPRRLRDYLTTYSTYHEALPPARAPTGCQRRRERPTTRQAIRRLRINNDRAHGN